MKNILEEIERSRRGDVEDRKRVSRKGTQGNPTFSIPEKRTHKCRIRSADAIGRAGWCAKKYGDGIDGQRML